MRAIAESVKDLDTCDINSAIVEKLDSRIEATIAEIHSQDFWKALTDPSNRSSAPSCVRP
jgi:hypothetical protein